MSVLDLEERVAFVRSDVEASHRVGDGVLVKGWNAAVATAALSDRNHDRVRYNKVEFEKLYEFKELA